MGSELIVDESCPVFFENKGYEIRTCHVEVAKDENGRWQVYLFGRLLGQTAAPVGRSYPFESHAAALARAWAIADTFGVDVFELWE
jgi:hypothetical protein